MLIKHGGNPCTKVKIIVKRQTEQNVKRCTANGKGFFSGRERSRKRSHIVKGSRGNSTRKGMGGSVERLGHMALVPRVRGDEG